MIATDTLEINETTDNFDDMSDSYVTDELKIEEPLSGEPETNEPETENAVAQNATAEETPARIHGASSFAEINRRIVNDNGQFIDDESLESEFTAFIKEYEDKESYELDKSAVFYSKLESLHKAYSEKISIAERINSGTATKCKIQVAMILNMEKKYRRMEGKQWVNHFERTYGKKGLRSAQLYMALAKVPNVLQHAAIGKERLTKILRAIKTLGITGDDPIAVLFQRYGIQFDPNSKFDETVTDLKLGVDYVLAVAKIKKAEKKGADLGVDLDLIKRMINEGHSVSSQFIADLFKIKSENRDVNAHIKSFFDKDANRDEMLLHIKRMESFPDLVEVLKNTVESIRTHQALADRIKPDDVNELENFVVELKNLVENSASTGE
jgi:hypothetical protein